MKSTTYLGKASTTDKNSCSNDPYFPTMEKLHRKYFLYIMYYRNSFGVFLPMWPWMGEGGGGGGRSVAPVTLHEAGGGGGGGWGGRSGQISKALVSFLQQVVLNLNQTGIKMLTLTIQSFTLFIPDLCKKMNQTSFGFYSNWDA